MSHSPVTLFFFRVLLWLPVMFAVWYFMAIVAVWPVTYLVREVLLLWLPEVISAVGQSGYRVETALYYTVENTVPEVSAELVFEVNALSYGYCVPLYTALLLASPGEEGVKWFRWISGMLILLMTQTWGVLFDILKSLLADVGSEVSGQIFSTQWQMDMIVLGYQFGYLVLPAITPIIIWMAFHLDFLKTLAPNLTLPKQV